MTHINTSLIARIYSALSDPLRIRILRLLLERELCVCEIIRVVKQPQYKVSRHLGVLKRAGLLHDWKDGTWAHYEINPDLPPLWRKALDAMRLTWDEDRLIQEDLNQLRRSSATRLPGVPIHCKA
ncbi:MAG TPA: metalloregulator ArsR/SmtB family transcription factor [Elusimicrobiota bacterium]|nr:metalloregulator ArsR/SmtB family transcription factor [Elusimicrobiota bacterium]